MLVSSAEETTAGSPHASTISNARTDAAERRHLDDDEVGGAPAGDEERVLSLADRLVRCNGNVDRVAGQGGSQLGKLIDSGAGLLSVFDAVCR